jgi:hypothetical protein
MGGIDLEILTDVHVFSGTDYEKLIFVTPSICLHVCLLMERRTDGRTDGWMMNE